MAMVRAAARMAEAELARHLLSRRGAESQRSTSGMSIALEALGRHESLLTIDDGGSHRSTVRLTPRHSEIMLLLASAPRGLSGDELAVLLYAEDNSASTLRAELNRLRSLLGDHLLASRPYRLVAEVTGDWLAVEAHLASGDVVAATQAYRGPVLPRSVAPGVVRLRTDVELSLRQAVLEHGVPDLMSSWTRSSGVLTTTRCGLLNEPRSASLPRCFRSSPARSQGWTGSSAPSSDCPGGADATAMQRCVPACDAHHRPASHAAIRVCRKARSAHLHKEFSMKAAVVHDFTKSLSIDETPKPVPGPGEVLVRVERPACARPTSTPRTATAHQADSALHPRSRGGRDRRAGWARRRHTKRGRPRGHAVAGQGVRNMRVLRRRLGDAVCDAGPGYGIDGSSPYATMSAAQDAPGPDLGPRRQQDRPR